MEMDLARGAYGITLAAENIDTGQVRSTATDRDGTYALRGLDPGTWRISASYDSLCARDRDYVPVYYDDSPTAFFSQLVRLEAGAVLEWDPGLWRDDDRDGMGDSWEREYGLDPTIDDGSEDLDGDGVSNLDEYRLGTDPSEVVPRSCGCALMEPHTTGWFMLLWLPLVARRR